LGLKLIEAQAHTFGPTYANSTSLHHHHQSSTNKDNLKKSTNKEHLVLKGNYNSTKKLNKIPSVELVISNSDFSFLFFIEKY